MGGGGEAHGAVSNCKRCDPALQNVTTLIPVVLLQVNEQM